MGHCCAGCLSFLQFGTGSIHLLLSCIILRPRTLLSPCSNHRVSSWCRSCSRSCKGRRTSVVLEALQHLLIQPLQQVSLTQTITQEGGITRLRMHILQMMTAMRWMMVLLSVVRVSQQSGVQLEGRGVAMQRALSGRGWMLRAVP